MYIHTCSCSVPAVDAACLSHYYYPVVLRSFQKIVGPVACVGAAGVCAQWWLWYTYNYVSTVPRSKFPAERGWLGPGKWGAAELQPALQAARNTRAQSRGVFSNNPYEGATQRTFFNIHPGKTVPRPRCSSTYKCTSILTTPEDWYPNPTFHCRWYLGAVSKALPSTYSLLMAYI